MNDGRILVLMHRKPAYSILELIIAVTVISILVSVAVANFGSTKVRARDANRRLSVGNYSTTMDQWKAAKGTYFVEGNEGCDGNSMSVQGKGMKGQGAGCVGWHGGSVGQMTRIKSSNGYLSVYQSQSIAQVLLEKGYLSRIQTDPLDRNFTDPSVRDFVLTLCTDYSAPPEREDLATHFAVFANLEKPSEAEETNAKEHCGGSYTNGGWDLWKYTKVDF